jgi:hypothetical protein
MTTLSATLGRALVAEHQRDALARARAYRLGSALRWQRRAAKAAARAQRINASL